MHIHRDYTESGIRLVASQILVLAPYPVLCVLLLFSMLGCSGAEQSVDALFVSASSQLASAQEVGAEQRAKPEFDEAEALLAEAEVAMKNKDKGARFLLERANAKARLAKALARQSKAEEEAKRAEEELEEASAEASRAREERKSAEDELERSWEGKSGFGEAKGRQRMSGADQ